MARVHGAPRARQSPSGQDPSGRAAARPAVRAGLAGSPRRVPAPASDAATPGARPAAARLDASVRLAIGLFLFFFSSCFPSSKVLVSSLPCNEHEWMGAVVRMFGAALSIVYISSLHFIVLLPILGLRVISEFEQIGTQWKRCMKTFVKLLCFFNHLFC